VAHRVSCLIHNRIKTVIIVESETIAGVESVASTIPCEVHNRGRHIVKYNFHIVKLAQGSRALPLRYRARCIFPMSPRVQHDV
jgi:hypothetical protein